MGKKERLYSLFFEASEKYSTTTVMWYSGKKKTTCSVWLCPKLWFV